MKAPAQSFLNIQKDFCNEDMVKTRKFQKTLSTKSVEIFRRVSFWNETFNLRLK